MSSYLCSYVECLPCLPFFSKKYRWMKNETNYLFFQHNLWYATLTQKQNSYWFIFCCNANFGKMYSQKSNNPMLFRSWISDGKFCDANFFWLFFADPFYVRIRITPIKLINISMFSWKLFFMWVGEDIERNIEIKSRCYRKASYNECKAHSITSQYNS